MRGSPERIIDEPEGVAEDVCLAVAALIGYGVGLAECVWVPNIGDVFHSLDMWGEIVDDVGVIH